jgi:hypothetical protein
MSNKLRPSNGKWLEKFARDPIIKYYRLGGSKDRTFIFLSPRG